MPLPKSCNLRLGYGHNRDRWYPNYMTSCETHSHTRKLIVSDRLLDNGVIKGSRAHAIPSPFRLFKMGIRIYSIPGPSIALYFTFSILSII